ncbi:hypothetical protein [Amycolatopsis sp. TNS106]|uniref:hypothetical protein n=1 Tax=Amycolatopsis sp. TNS106 TaxID=2861750 RepID=UPI001C59D9D8|nr:hypothetical protein [Amycolatopsis sp. TNS106]
MTTMITIPAASPALAWDHAGNLGLGQRLDGAGLAWFDLADDVNVSSGVISGPKGSGKSTTVRALVAAARASQAVPVTTLYTAPFGGLDNPLLARIASVPVLGGAPDTVIGLLRDAAEVRAEILRERGLATLAGTELPILLAVVENAAQVVGGRPHRWARLARHATKLGIALLATLEREDDPSLPAGQRALWRQLAETNRIRMRGHGTEAGTARVRDGAGHEYDTRVPFFPDGDPWVHTEIAPDDPLDAATAAVFGDYYTAPAAPRMTGSFA